MSAPAIPVGHDAPTPADDATNMPSRRRPFISLRIKLVVLFAGLFTIVFVGVSIWVVQFAAQAAQERLAQQLRGQVEGAAKAVDAATFAELVATVPAVPDPADKTGFGYPDSPLYREVALTLFNAFQVTGSGTYTWFKDPADGQIYTAASSGYYRDPQTGYRYKVPLSDVAGPSTYAFMDQGLTQTTEEPAYTDAYGSWMSAYTPILDANGQSVGGIGQDISLDYVSEVRSKAISQVLPVLAGVYVILVILVWVLASRIVRPIRRLTVESGRISEGDYDVDLDALSHTRIRDEISKLADSFSIMSSKVAEREQSLKVEVKRLKVEIDATKRAEAVKAIVDTEGFADLAERAAQMRKRMTEDRD
ncbi:MAG: HAMP domain-containing protein [Actinomycetales bacterium]|nr:HAMP domain-containing protein [Actinomycetales bacterium]